MRDLERELRTARVQWPPTPDVAAAVHARIAAEPRASAPARRTFGARRLGLAHAAAVAVAVLAAAMAVPPARSAILELLGLQGVRIERREPRPPRDATAPAPLGASLGLGRRVSAREARRLAGFVPAPPKALGAPDAVWFAPRPAGGMVSYVYRPRPGLPEARETGLGLLVTQFAAMVTPFIEKAAASGTRIERVRVDGHPGFWLSGEPHGFSFLDREDRVGFEDQRLAGRTLLVERGGIVLRLEGRLSRERAVAIARSVPAGG